MPTLLWLLLGFFVSSALLGQHLTPPEARQLAEAIRQSPPDTHRVTLLLQLARHHVFKPGEVPADLDSARALAHQAAQLSRQLHDSVGLGRSYWLYSQADREQGERERGLRYIDQAIALFTHLYRPEDLGEAYLEKRHYYSIYTTEEDFYERMHLLEQAQVAFSQTHNVRRQAECLQELGDLHHVISAFPQAIAHLKEALRLYESIAFPRVQGVYDLLGSIYNIMGDTREGLRYGLLAVETGEMLQDSSSQMSTIYNRLGLTYYNLSEWEPALLYFRKSLAIIQRNQDQSNLIYLDKNIVNTLLKLNRPDEALAFHEALVRQYPARESPEHLDRLQYLMSFVTIHQVLKQYDAAQRYCDEMLALAQDAAITYHRYIYHIAIRFFLDSRQYERARRYLQLFQQHAELSSEPLYLADAAYYGFKLDSAQGNFRAALDQYQHYKAWQDTVFNENKSKQIAQLQIQYETDKKDQELKLQQQDIRLLTQERDLQASRLQQAALTRNVSFGGLALMLLIVGLLFNRYRLKQRSHRQLQAQQEEIQQKNQSLEQLVGEKEWLLKEIHHRVKNNLQIVMSLLNSQSAYIDNAAALGAIRESQARMQAMALIHQKLYQTENVARIDMPLYIQDLVTYLRDSFDVAYRLHFRLDVVPVELDVAQAVPLGLILNEGITNALKYAFPGETGGTISLVLSQANGQFRLTIADDGVGLPAELEVAHSRSLGMSLMQGLSQQLNGQLQLDNRPGRGLTLLVSFPDENAFQPEPSRQVALPWHHES
ncbi:Two-component sensor histidine kinase, contains HisKA and HATPase domains [Catalinimonas alkaloidigena]|uniref:histidine kinase n=1 Tax=Catalinimonas alkaloidigena TaxID=1075417 RepID=A0A1G9TH90_9BACT|nr:histidine kinase dimerization/phosphoacceptor domain -containing protein [Catalinimonas alkaloidigena]SDM47149.1 Two-component sensor histidine kinase, contains HisKA and HATPase domains [Catalinimonas alkaloidigena]